MCNFQHGFLITLKYISIDQKIYPVFFLSRKRKRRSDVVVVRGRLRLYSASGFFLLLGLIILALGIGMATLGYWPHSETTSSAKSQSGGGSKTNAGEAKTSAKGERNGAKMGATKTNSSTRPNVQGMSHFFSTVSPKLLILNGSFLHCVLHVGTPSKQTGGILARFLEQHRHSERMKMLGPFTMGIGIFIFICANAILHENRDRETKVRLKLGTR